MEEIWRYIEGYENYSVSNYGNIKHNNICKKIYTDNRGRKRVRLGNKYYFVHRIVAKTFPEICGEWFEDAVIDHLDTNPSNNLATNLKVCTQHENLLNPITRKKKTMSKTGANNPLFNKRSYQHNCSKPIVQLDMEGNLIHFWYCTADVQRKLGYSYKAISMALNGKTRTSNGYKWMFMEDYLSNWWDKEMDTYMVKEKVA